MGNIRDLYVSYEIAKSLKELGFKELCNFFYTESGKLFPRVVESGYEPMTFEADDFYENFNTITRYEVEGKYQHVISAPTYYEVIEWLRVNHGIWISVYRQRHSEDKHYGYVIKQPNEIETRFWGFKSPKEAYSEAIEKSLKMIDKKELKKGGDIENKKNKETMSDKNEIFEEIADYGDQMYFTRDFGYVIIGEEDDKEIPLVLVAEISDYYEATGEDEFKEKPFVISIDIYPRIDFIDKAHIDSCAHSCGIQPEEVGYTDLKSYGLGIPLLLKDFEEGFESMEEAEEFIKSDDLMKKLNSKSMLIGFFMDGAINRAGNSRWSYLEYALNKDKSFY